MVKGLAVYHRWGTYNVHDLRRPESYESTGSVRYFPHCGIDNKANPKWSLGTDSDKAMLGELLRVSSVSA